MNPAAPFLILEEFLAPEEMRRVRAHALRQERIFRQSRVVPRSGTAPAENLAYRKSRVLFELGPLRALFSNRLLHHLDYVRERLGVAPFEVRHVETQMTASNDGDLFRVHNDSTDAKAPSREITFVYFFHKEPRPFSGGELRIYGEAPQSWTITPEQNSTVLFHASRRHEVLPVACPSGAFADSRFTLNGWVHRR